MVFLGVVKKEKSILQGWADVYQHENRNQKGKQRNQLHIWPSCGHVVPFLVSCARDLEKENIRKY